MNSKSLISLYIPSVFLFYAFIFSSFSTHREPIISLCILSFLFLCASHAASSSMHPMFPVFNKSKASPYSMPLKPSWYFNFLLPLSPPSLIFCKFSISTYSMHHILFPTWYTRNIQLLWTFEVSTFSTHQKLLFSMNSEYSPSESIVKLFIIYASKDALFSIHLVVYYAFFFQASAAPLKSTPNCHLLYPLYASQPSIYPKPPFLFAPISSLVYPKPSLYPQRLSHLFKILRLPIIYSQSWKIRV